MQVSEAINYLDILASCLDREKLESSTQEFWFSLSLKEEGWEIDYGHLPHQRGLFPLTPPHYPAVKIVEDLFEDLRKDFEKLKEGFSCDCCGKSFDVVVTGFTLLFYFDEKDAPVTKTSYNTFAIGEKS